MIKHLFIVSFISALFSFSAEGQSFAPPAGFPGSTAIHKDSSILIDWAFEIDIYRSYTDIAFPENGYVTFGEAGNAIGAADGNPNVVSLGDGGYAILQFTTPIVNGEGADFAVFENGFFLNDTSENAFLELAFVEVSTDGIEYIKFPSVSEIESDFQIGSFEHMNARYFHNLAGKYTVFYGTPFDLEDLKELSAGTSVNLNKIQYIKITDVVGCIQEAFARYDSEGNTINDPYPTAFESGGFDLDAIGVINNISNTIHKTEGVMVYPNPTEGNLYVDQKENDEFTIQIFNLSGYLISEFRNQNSLDLSFMDTGFYILHFKGNKTNYSVKFCKL